MHAQASLAATALPRALFRRRRPTSTGLGRGRALPVAPAVPEPGDDPPEESTQAGGGGEFGAEGGNPEEDDQPAWAGQGYQNQADDDDESSEQGDRQPIGPENSGMSIDPDPGSAQESSDRMLRADSDLDIARKAGAFYEVAIALVFSGHNGQRKPLGWVWSRCALHPGAGARRVDSLFYSLEGSAFGDYWAEEGIAFAQAHPVDEPHDDAVGLQQPGSGRRTGSGARSANARAGSAAGQPDRA